ncbi:MAG: hypothetical protein ACRDOK_17555 [Streptosporangiaceae bacterium]
MQPECRLEVAAGLAFGGQQTAASLRPGLRPRLRLGGCFADKVRCSLGRLAVAAEAQAGFDKLRRRREVNVQDVAGSEQGVLLL